MSVLEPFDLIKIETHECVVITGCKTTQEIALVAFINNGKNTISEVEWFENHWRFSLSSDFCEYIAENNPYIKHLKQTLQRKEERLLCRQNQLNNFRKESRVWKNCRGGRHHFAMSRILLESAEKELKEMSSNISKSNSSQ